MTVYFLGCEGRIKVGYSRDPESRIKELSTGAPAKLTLLGRVDGSRKLESAIHRALRNCRESGEWFRDYRAVRVVMQEVLDGTFEERGDFKYPELMAALQRIAAPIGYGFISKREAIDRAAASTGLPRWRVFDIWYGKARRVEVPEALAIRGALENRINGHDHGFDPPK
jgi:hypothetical protein